MQTYPSFNIFIPPALADGVCTPSSKFPFWSMMRFLCYQLSPESCFLNKVTKDNTFTGLKKTPGNTGAQFWFFLSPGFSNLSGKYLLADC